MTHCSSTGKCIQVQVHAFKMKTYWNLYRYRRYWPCIYLVSDRYRNLQYRTLEPDRYGFLGADADTDKKKPDTDISADIIYVYIIIQ